MPKFVARLEATDGSGHFRRTVIYADTIDRARDILERRELGYATFRLTADEIAELEKKEADAAKKGLRLSPDDRQKLVYHRQAEPYQLAWIGDTDPPRDKKRKAA